MTTPGEIVLTLILRFANSKAIDFDPEMRAPLDIEYKVFPTSPMTPMTDAMKTILPPSSKTTFFLVNHFAISNALKTLISNIFLIRSGLIDLIGKVDVTPAQFTNPSNFPPSTIFCPISPKSCPSEKSKLK